MGFDISIPGLRLGLGLGLQDHDERKQRQRQKKKEGDSCNKAYPSLTLGPPPDDDVEANNNEPISKTESDEYYYFHPHASSPSAVLSSFSNECIKRERDQFAGEEVQKILQSRVVDLHENGNPNKKLRLTKQQSAILEDSFKEHSTLTPKQKQELAKKLNLRPRQVEVWFQNRRARTKLKQTEVECELLKKWCESLTEEKKMLQKELEELKLMKARVGVGPYYMQLPVASLTICPSCDKICGGGGSGATKNGSSPTTALLLGPKAHHSFYKTNCTFTQSSAAC